MHDRASSLLALLRKTEHDKSVAMNKEKNIPAFAVGDAVEVKVRGGQSQKLPLLPYMAHSYNHDDEVEEEEETECHGLTHKPYPCSCVCFLVSLSFSS